MCVIVSVRFRGCVVGRVGGFRVCGVGWLVVSRCWFCKDVISLPDIGWFQGLYGSGAM